jgi:hypothetical protein
VGVGATSEDLQWICKLTNLRGICLAYAELQDADLECLRSLKHLQWLNLLEAKLPKSDVSRLPDFPDLEVLFFDGDDVTDDHLPEIGQCPKLEVLTLNYSAITDNGIRKIVQAHPRLRFLHLAHARGVTNLSVPELAKLKELKFMHLGDTSLYEIRQLRNRLPNCFISIEN